MLLTAILVLTSLSGCSTKKKEAEASDPVTAFDGVEIDGQRVITAPKLVKTMTEYGVNYENSARFTFEYTDIPVSASRYSMMINNLLFSDLDNNYYKYNWN